MKKVLLLALLTSLALPFTSCQKAPSVEPIAEEKPVVQQPTKTDLISREWTLTEVATNGHSMSANEAYSFAKDGTVKAYKDANGNWKSSGKWQFEENESRIRLFAGQAGKEMVWSLVSLTDKKFEAEWMPMSSERYTMTLAAN